MGFFDDFDERAARSAIDARLDERRRVYMEWETAAQRFAAEQIPPILRDFIAKVAVLCDPVSITRDRTMGWDTKLVGPDSDSTYHVATDGRLFLVRMGYDYGGPVESEELAKSLSPRPPFDSAGARSRLVSSLRQRLQGIADGHQ